MASSEVWSNKVDFYMTALSYTVGLSCLWRFPFLCYKDGGGFFLVPFVLLSILLGFPLVTLELTLGQFGRRGPVKVWNLCPLFEGIGWSMVVVNFMSNTYFVMLIAYGLYYLGASFISPLPWASCDNAWNTERCMDARSACIQSGMTWTNNTCVPKEYNYNLYVPDNQDTSGSFPAIQPGEEYFYRAVLQLSNGIEELGSIRWSLALCLLIAWGFIILALFLGPKTWGKFSYVTAIVPFVVLLGLLIQASLLPGAGEGIKYYMFPDWRKLGTLQVWGDAAIQVFFSLGLGLGSYITIGKFNHFHANPIVDAGIIVLANMFASIFCGFVVFALIGHLADAISQPVSDLATSGMELAFVSLPHAVATLPSPNVWSVLFFLALICLGFGSVIPTVANILVTLPEVFPKLNSGLYQFFVLLGLVAGSFLFGLFYTTNGGLYRLILVDFYGPSIPPLILLMLQVLAVAWVYGSWHLLKDLSVMTGWWRCFVFFAFWNVLSPLAILLMLVYQLYYWTGPGVGHYLFPRWANIAGWLLTVAELIIVPIHLVYVLVTYGIRHRIRQTIRPTKEWGPEPRGPNDAGMIQPTTEMSKV